MLKEDEPIGVISITAKMVRPFTEKQIELANTFADQAVIAIENVRLFDELARTAISCNSRPPRLKCCSVISSSPGELQPVFDAMLANAVRLCAAKFR